MVYVGIDLGGTSIKAGLVDEQGKILCKATCPTLVERGARPVVDDMAKLSLEVIEKGGYTLDDVKAIGVGLPGIQDPRTGIVPFCTNLYWHEVPVIEWMQETINKPIYIGNDATVAGLAESVAGVSAGIENSVFLTLGTGVGGGILTGGVSAQQELLIDPLAEKVRASVMHAFAEGLELKSAALQNDAGLVGAVYYFKKHHD